MINRKTLVVTLPVSLCSGLLLSSCVSPSQGGQTSDGVYADPNNPYAVPGLSTEGSGYGPANQSPAYSPVADNVGYQPIPDTNVNIPASAPSPTPAPRRPSTPSASSNSGRHTVTSGDTLYGLSRRYGVSVGALKEANGLTGDVIRTGQALSIPR